MTAHHNSPRLSLLILFVILLALSACSFLREQIATPQPKQIHVTADLIARAMQEDHFYSDYGQNTLIVQGTALSDQLQGGHHILEMKTQIDTIVLCDFGSQAPMFTPGSSLTAQSPDASQAQRLPNAVLLVNCTLP